MTDLSTNDLSRVLGGAAEADLLRSLEACTYDGNCAAPTQEQARAGLAAFDAAGIAGYGRHLELHQHLAGGAPLAPWQKK